MHKMNDTDKDPIVYWNKKLPDTQLEIFQNVVEKKYNCKFDSYWEFHKWTIENYVQFWEEIWHFFGVISSKPYNEVLVKTGPGFLDNEWFSGARLNYAENLLRIRDDRLALIWLDENGNEETITFAEMFEEVKLYAAAFRKNGLEIGDRVACFMPNRKEAIFALLATASIGAIFGGPIPFYGAQAASVIIKAMDPKFLIMIDSYQDNGIVFQPLEHLPEIFENVSTIEKVIVIDTQEETHRKDLSNFHNCVFLHDFLCDGYTSHGNVPSMAFEQLSFNHPLFINFTSGTTGSPKPIVHSAGTFLSLMRDFAISYNMKSGEVACLNYSVGWSVWCNFIPCLALGLPLFLYCGNVFYTVNNRNIWDHLAKYNAKIIMLIPSMVEKMERMQIIPSPGTDMSCLKEVLMLGSPAQKNNFEFLLAKVKNDLFVGNRYGATELFGSFSGFDMNMPVYEAEIQVPSLGLDVQCFDSEGNSVVGQKGELVICTPAINFLSGIWKDVNKAYLTHIYLSKFPGAWSQHDECWINPKTKGFVIIGRSDDTLKQSANRFGAAEIYFAIHSLEELQDYVCVSQKNYKNVSRAVLFVKMQQGYTFGPDIKAKITKMILEALWQGCVPELILEIPDIPYNFNNKRMESLVRKIIETNEIPKVMNIRNPECLKHYLNIPEIMLYNQ